MGKRRNGGSPPDPSSPLERLARRPAVCLLVIAVIGLLAYSNTFHVPFVFDDEPAITDNPLIKNLGHFLSQPEGHAYNPRRYVAYLTFAINYRIGGLDVTGYHAFNIVVHLINAFLVFALARLSFRTPFLKESDLAPFSGVIACFAALFFVVHPVQTQAVTYIVQRMTSLATLFSLASLCLYARWRLDPESGNTLWNKTSFLYASSLVALVLAMKTKEIAFTIPVLIALYDRFFFGTTRTRYLVPVLLTLLIIPLSLLHVDRPVGEILSDVSAVTRVKSHLSRWEYLMTQLTVIVTYLRLLALPVHQNLDYDFPVAREFLSGSVLGSALLLLAIVSGGVCLYLRSRPERKTPLPELRLVSYGIAWFFIALLVESSIIPISDVMFEHRIYLPSVGVFLALGVGAAAACVRFGSGAPRLRTGVVGAMFGTVIVLAILTFARNDTWRDAVRLWSDVVEKSPGKARAHYNLGLANDRKGNPEEALKHYVTSIALDPYNGKAHDNLGTLLAKQGREPEAIGEFRTALELNPDDAAAHNNLGNVFAKLERWEDALTEYRRALAADPEHVEAYFNMGRAYERKGDFERATRAYSAALQLDPRHGAARNNLGLLYARQGRLEDAAAEFRAAVAMDGSDVEAWNNLGIATARQGRTGEAILHFREALRHSGANAEVHYNLGMAYLAAGRPSEAIPEFKAALAIDPGHARSRRRLEETEKRLSGDR